MAGIVHRAVLMTNDIDVVVPRGLVDEFIVTGEEHGIVLKQRYPDGWHRLLFRDPEGDVPISIVLEGGRSTSAPVDTPLVPGPKELGVSQGVGYASFAGWVEMKLVANRPKDRFHIIEGLKRAGLAELTDTRRRLSKLRVRYQQEFERLMRAAQSC